MNDLTGYIKSGQLIKELKAGEESAFDFLFRSRYKKLCRFAWAFVGDYSVAEDIVQELFSNIWRRKETIDERQSIDNYLYVSVRNACYAHLRVKKQNVELSALLNEAIVPDWECDFESPVLRTIWNAVEALPLQCKGVFKLVVLEDMKYREVADCMGISVNSVKTQMKIAYKELRTKLDRNQMLLLFFFYRYLDKKMFFFFTLFFLFLVLYLKR